MTANKIKVETLCQICRQPISTVRITEERLSRTLIYPVLDPKRVVMFQGRYQHKGCIQ